MIFRYWDRDSDYEVLEKWWKFWRFPAPSKNILPNTGLVLNINGEDVVCGFVYFSNSDLCWIEFIVSSPNVKDKQVREEMIKAMINKLCDVASDAGYSVAYTSLKHEGLQNKYLECGFVEGSRNCNEYIKNIK